MAGKLTERNKVEELEIGEMYEREGNIFECSTTHTWAASV